MNVPGCHRCQMNDPTKTQTYDVSDSKRGVHLFINVTAAYAFARARLTPIEIPVDIAERMILVNMSETFCGAHVDHVDRTLPPLVAIYEASETEIAYLLLDGTHRLFAAIKHGEKTMAYVLQPHETRIFIMEENREYTGI